MPHSPFRYTKEQLVLLGVAYGAFLGSLAGAVSGLAWTEELDPMERTSCSAQLLRLCGGFFIMWLTGAAFGGWCGLMRWVELKRRGQAKA